MNNQTTNPVFHGSDIEKVCEIYGLRREDIIMFGANVNPLGLSEHVKEQLAGRLDILSSYPDRNYTSLCSTISEYCNIPAEFILPGNGSSELIALLIQERNPKHTLIPGSDLFRIRQGALLLRKYTGILSSARRG